MKRRSVVALIVALALGAGAVYLATSLVHKATRTEFVAYFDNSNGMFVGDDVVILGVRVGSIKRIEPQPKNAKVTFWVDDKYKVPADVRAVIVSPKLITSRAIQLTPAYTGGPTLPNGAVISQDRTLVPVEWDDFRDQLQKLTDALQPDGPNGVSPLGAVINTAADNLRGQGAQIRDTLIKLSQAVSILGDGSDNIYATVKNLSLLVSALRDSGDLMRRLNTNLASVTGLLADDPDKIGRALDDLATAVSDVQAFLSSNRERIGTTSDKLASVSTALASSLDDVKQTLHVLPNVLQNFINIYEPAHGSISGILAVNNFADPISFLCGSIQAASRLNSEQSAKLCVQYLAPIVKNRQYNFPPIGVNPFVNASTRPNEITYSEDWLRPNQQPPAAPPPAPGPGLPIANAPVLPAEVGTPTNPAEGLPGMMVQGEGH